MWTLNEIVKDLKSADFKNSTFRIFNMLDDDGIIRFWENQLKNRFSIDDIEYYEFTLTDKEKFLTKMYNKEFLQPFRDLMSKFATINGIMLNIEYDFGIIRVIKLKSLQMEEVLKKC